MTVWLCSSILRIQAWIRGIITRRRLKRIRKSDRSTQSINEGNMSQRSTHAMSRLVELSSATTKKVIDDADTTLRFSRQIMAQLDAEEQRRKSHTVTRPRETVLPSSSMPSSSPTMRGGTTLPNKDTQWCTSSYTPP